MPRAKRYHIPGYVWHITHRCHKREFLLKFVRDRRRWVQWLFEAKKRYGLIILNYMVTSNHVHLLLFDSGDSNAIARSVQLIAGRTAQEFNKRKNRAGAFWQDRYHATAVESGKHFRQCLVYIDMNMVRAGVVAHPYLWEFCGYNEIQRPRKRYSLIDHERLLSLSGSSQPDQFRDAHAAWIDEALRIHRSEREDRWTQSIGVGSEGFIETLKRKLGHRARGRGVNESGIGFELREPILGYNADYSAENAVLSLHNKYLWNVNCEYSTS